MSARTEWARATRSLVLGVALLIVHAALSVFVLVLAWRDALPRRSFGLDEWMAAGSVLLLPLLGVLFVGALAARRDVARRLAAERERYEQVAEASAEWMWATDADGRIVESNGAVERLLGYAVDDVLGRSGWEIVADEDAHHVASEVLDAVDAGETFTGLKLRCRTRDGSFRWVESAGAVIRRGDGRVAGFRGVTRDVHHQVVTLAEADEVQARRSKEEAEIRSVLDAPALLAPVFQPIATIPNGFVVGVEALARFSGDLARPPDAWFRQAARVGLDAELELLALAKAVESLGELSASCYLSINVSASTLVDDRLVDVIRAAGADASRLVFEVTEHDAVESYDELEPVRESLAAAGCRLAVDDAGAGYATLRHILRLRPDVIKLDRDIVSDVDADPARRALITAMAAFAREVGALLVAEGVETREEFAALVASGVRLGQGWLLARPGTLPLASLRLPVPAVDDLVGRATSSP